MEERNPKDELVIESLRQPLLSYVNSNEKMLIKFNKILRRLTVIFFVLVFSLLVGAGFIVYTNITNENFFNQRRTFNEKIINSQKQIIAQQDSIKNKQNSIDSIIKNKN